MDRREMGPVSPDTSVITNIRCVTSQKSEYLIYTAVEASNHVSYFFTIY